MTKLGRHVDRRNWFNFKVGIFKKKWYKVSFIEKRKYWFKTTYIYRSFIVSNSDTNAYWQEITDQGFVEPDIYMQHALTDIWDQYAICGFDSFNTEVPPDQKKLEDRIKALEKENKELKVLLEKKNIEHFNLN